jgi:hypothetical protein
MELVQGKISNYTGQAKVDAKDKDKLNDYLVSVDRDLTNLWRIMNYISPLIGSSKSVLTTDSSIGFSYIPTMLNPPLGTPTNYAGKVAMVFCTSNSSLYMYNSSNNNWKVVILT